MSMQNMFIHSLPISQGSADGSFSASHVVDSASANNSMVTMNASATHAVNDPTNITSASVSQLMYTSQNPGMYAPFMMQSQQQQYGVTATAAPSGTMMNACVYPGVMQQPTIPTAAAPMLSSAPPKVEGTSEVNTAQVPMYPLMASMPTMPMFMNPASMANYSHMTYSGMQSHPMMMFVNPTTMMMPGQGFMPAMTSGFFSPTTTMPMPSAPVNTTTTTVPTAPTPFSALQQQQQQRELKNGEGYIMNAEYIGRVRRYNVEHGYGFLTATHLLHSAVPQRKKSTRASRRKRVRDRVNGKLSAADGSSNGGGDNTTEIEEEPVALGPILVNVGDIFVHHYHIAAPHRALPVGACVVFRIGPHERTNSIQAVEVRIQEAEGSLSVPTMAAAATSSICTWVQNQNEEESASERTSDRQDVHAANRYDDSDSDPSDGSEK